MSDVENGEGHFVPGNQNLRPLVPPDMWSPPYPSLICMQCQEREFLPVLPSAPYPVTPDLEDAAHPKCSPMLKDVGKLVASPGQYSTNVFPTRNVEVDPAVTHEARAHETTIVSFGAENEKRKLRKSHICKVFWIKCAFLVLFLFAAILVLSVLPVPQIKGRGQDS